MTLKTKQATLALATLAVAAAAFCGWKFVTTTGARDELAALRPQHAATISRLTTLEEQLAMTAERARAVESDNALLASALKQAERAQAEKAAKAAMPVTRERVAERLKQARLLLQTGDPAEALRELLWCYDEGYPRLGGSAMSVGISSVISALGALGARYPEALAVLRERLDARRQHVLAGPEGSDAVGEFSALARTLKDDPAVLAVFDQLPPGDPRRKALGIYAFEPLLTARRYGDALEGRSYAMMSSSFEILTQERALPATIPNPERIREFTRKAVIDTVAKNIEALAGTGDLTQAQALADRLLAYDNTEATKALILKHATRAGRPDLLSARKP